MKSSAFDGFHLSDLEYGVRLHHDMLRGILPVMTRDVAPAETDVAVQNAEMLNQRLLLTTDITQNSGGTTQ